MRRIKIFIMLIMLSFAVAPVAGAAEQNMRSVESFDFLIDGSSSMHGGKDGSSLGGVLKRINDRIPDLGYPEAGIHTFATPGEVLGFAPYDRGHFESGIDSALANFPNGKNTSLGDGFDHYGPMFSDMLRRGAVIVFTDGEYSSGRDSLNEAKIFYLTEPAMCLHFVSFARTQKAQNLIDEMSAISPCSVSVHADALMGSDEVADEFVRRVFYGGNQGVTRPGVSEYAPLPTLKGGLGGQDAAPMHLGEDFPPIDFVMLSLPFAFDSDKLDAKTTKVAQALADRMKTNPNYRLKIDGYTCSIGPVAYNLDLSQRRANTVKNYIVNSGVAASRISTEGFGMANPRYDNGTFEGRSLNRRVEFTFTDTSTGSSTGAQYEVEVPN